MTSKDQPDSPAQMADRIRSAADRLNRTLSECNAQRVSATLAVVNGRLVVEKITRQREEEVLWPEGGSEDG